MNSGILTNAHSVKDKIMSDKQTTEAGDSLPKPLNYEGVFMASITDISGDVWLHVEGPNGNKGALNLSQLVCGSITRNAFIDWGRAHIHQRT